MNNAKKTRKVLAVQKIVVPLHPLNEKRSREAQEKEFFERFS